MLSIASVALVYLLGRRLFGDHVAFLASLSFSLVPTGVANATVYQVENLVFGFALIVLFLIWRVDDLKLTSKSAMLILLWPLLAVISVYVGVLLLLIFAIKQTYTKKKQLISPLLGLFLFFGTVLIFGNGEAALAAYQEWISLPENFLFLPLLVISIVQAVTGENSQTRLVGIVLVTITLALLVSSLLPSITPSEVSVISLLWVAVLLISWSDYLVERLQTRLGPWASIVLPFLTIILTWFLRQGFDILIVASPGLSISYIQYSLGLLAQVVMGLLFVGIVTSPLLINRSVERLANRFGLFISTGLIFVLLSFSGSTVSQYRQNWMASYQTILAIKELGSELPLITEDLVFTDHIFYMNGFERVTNFSKIDYPEILGVEEGMVVLPEFRISEVPPNWVLIDSLGEMGKKRLLLYQVLSNEKANDGLEYAKSLVETNPSPESYQQLYAILIHQGKRCEAYAVWMEARSLGYLSDDYIIVDPTATCLTNPSSHNLVGALDQRDAYYTSYLQYRPAEETQVDSGSLQLAHKYNYYFDPRTFDLTYPLEGRGFYVYSMDLRSQNPVYALYWRIGDQENYVTQTIANEWTSFAVLLYIPEDAEKLQDVHVSPALFDHLGFVEIKDVGLFAINHDEIVR
ncbi:MAG: hypothetical protein HND51_02240 [Chloroflexi bacterium]|nr:hypothetical protein [Chloroflexota bacterium]